MQGKFIWLLLLLLALWFLLSSKGRAVVNKAAQGISP